MKRAKSGNFIYKNNISQVNTLTTQKDKINKSISGNIFYSNYKDSKINSNSNSKFNEEYKVKNIDIKFNILHNYKKFKTIINNNSNSNIYPKILNNNQEDQSSNSKIHLKLFNNSKKEKPITSNINQYFLNEEKIEYGSESKDPTQLDIHGYFPDDFPLRAFKCTSFYKNRYKIQTKHLKNTLNNIYVDENAKRKKNIHNIIKKNNENTLSNEMLRLLKSNRIDRFVNRYLNLKNITFKNKKHNSRYINSSTYRYRKHYMTSKDQNDNDKKLNICINPYLNVKRGLNTINTKNFNHNYLIDNMKTNMANSGTQTINAENKNKDKDIINISKEKKKDFLTNNKFITNSPINNNNKLNENNFEIIGNLKKNMFCKKYHKKVRPFTGSKTIYNHKKNDIKNSENKRGLVFSLYDPKDKYIQLFEQFEKRYMESELHKSNV
jgi:hypothetical protein